MCHCVWSRNLNDEAVLARVGLLRQGRGRAVRERVVAHIMPNTQHTAMPSCWHSALAQKEYPQTSTMSKPYILYKPPVCIHSIVGQHQSLLDSHFLIHDFAEQHKRYFCDLIPSACDTFCIPPHCHCGTSPAFLQHRVHSASSKSVCHFRIDTCKIQLTPISRVMPRPLDMVFYVTVLRSISRSVLHGISCLIGLLTS